MAKIDTSVQGASAEINESRPSPKIGEFGRVAIIGNFPQGNQNEVLKFNDKNSAYEMMGDDPSFKSTRVIENVFLTDDIRGTDGASDIICVHAGETAKAKLTLQNEPTGGENAVNIIDLEIRQGGAHGNDYKVTISNGTYSDYLFILEKNGQTIMRRDDIPLDGLLGLFNTENSIISASKTNDYVEGMSLAHVSDSAFTGGSDASNISNDDLYQAMLAIKDETFRQLIFTDKPSDSFYPVVSDYLDQCLNITLPSGAVLPIPEDLSIMEKILIAKSTPNRFITFISTVFNEWDITESVAAYAGALASTPIGESLSHGSIGWIDKITPEYTLDERRSLAKSGITTFTNKNRDLGLYGVDAAMTASNRLDSKGEKHIECEQYATDTLVYVINYFDLPNRTGVTDSKIDKSNPVLNAQINQDKTRLLDANIATDMECVAELDNNNSRLSYLKVKLIPRNITKWIHAIVDIQTP